MLKTHTVVLFYNVGLVPEKLLPYNEKYKKNISNN